MATLKPSSKAVANWPETILFGFSFAFVLLWSFGHGSAYFLWTLPELVEDFRRTLFRPDHPREIADGFESCCLEPIYSNRLPQLRLHIVMTAINGLFMILQLSPQVRTKNYMRHKFLGYASNSLTFFFIIHMFYLLFVRGMPGMPDIIFWFDVVAYIAIVVGYVGGVIAITNRNIKLHRAMMMLCASGMLANPCQRFIWAILSQMDTKVTTFQEWIDGPTTVSSVLALAFNLGTAFYYGFVSKPLTLDMAHAGIAAQKKVD